MTEVHNSREKYERSECKKWMLDAGLFSKQVKCIYGIVKGIYIILIKKIYIDQRKDLFQYTVSQQYNLGED